MPSPDDEKPVAGDAPLIGQYYRGVICRLHRSPERGCVRTALGREIPFMFQHVRMLGSRTRFSDLRDGLVVGYDVAWTDKGLRVNVLRIPEGPGASRSVAPSEGQHGAEQQEAAHHLADEHREDGHVE